MAQVPLAARVTQWHSSRLGADCVFSGQLSSTLYFSLASWPDQKAIKAPGWKLASSLLEVPLLLLPALFNFIF